MTCPDCAGVKAGSRATCSCGRGLAWYQPSRAEIAAACEAIQQRWRPSMERSRRDVDAVLECPVAVRVTDGMVRREGSGD
jgi:hypothetical protein